MYAATTDDFTPGQLPDWGADWIGRRRKPTAGSGAPNESAPIREYFPSPVVQVIQKDAFQKLGLKQMMLQPEFLEGLEADVHLVADLISLRSVMPEKTIDTAREVVARVVAQLMEHLERKTAEAIRGSIDRSKRSFNPRFNDIDWSRTIQANLRHYQHKHKTIVPEKLIGFQRRQRRLVDLDEVTLCVDQSGSMATSVVYSSIFAAVMASLPVVKTRLICFDTSIIDLTEYLADPVKVLFGVQLGGGTDKAVAYCQDKIEAPSKSHLILITAAGADRPDRRAQGRRGQCHHLVGPIRRWQTLLRSHTRREGRLSRRAGLCLHSRSISRPDGNRIAPRGRAELGRQ